MPRSPGACLLRSQELDHQYPLPVRRLHSASRLAVNNPGPFPAFDASSLTSLDGRVLVPRLYLSSVNESELLSCGALVKVSGGTTSLIQQTAAAAQSTGTYGFNAGLQLDIDAEQSQTSVHETTSVASHLDGAGIVMQTGWRADGNHVQDGTTTTIQGSHLNADDFISIDTGQLDILASQDTYSSSNHTERGHVTAQMTVYGAAGGLNVNADFSRSQATSSGTTHTNSTLNANNIQLITTGDANIRGGNAHANEHLFTDIGGDLNLESVQDRHRSQDSSVGFNAGIGFGDAGREREEGESSNRQGLQDVGGVSSANVGFNQGSGSSTTRETVVSSLTSGGTVEVNVAGTARITGALIGTFNNEGNMIVIFWQSCSTFPPKVSAFKAQGTIGHRLYCLEQLHREPP